MSRDWDLEEGAEPVISDKMGLYNKMTHSCWCQHVIKASPGGNHTDANETGGFTAS